MYGYQWTKQILNLILINPFLAQSQLIRCLIIIRIWYFYFKYFYQSQCPGLVWGNLSYFMQNPSSVKMFLEFTTLSLTKPAGKIGGQIIWKLRYLVLSDLSTNMRVKTFIYSGVNIGRLTLLQYSLDHVRSSSIVSYVF